MLSLVNSRMQSHARAAALAVACLILSAPASASGLANLDGLQPSGSYDRFIVKYKAGSEQRNNPAALAVTLANAVRVLPTAGTRGLSVTKLRRLAVGGELIRVSRKLDMVEAELLMRRIAADPSVEYVQLDRVSQPTFVPNDTYFGQQYGMGTGSGGIRATNAWDAGDGNGIVVAVIDTGVVDHPDLDANMLGGYDFIADVTVSNDGDGRDDDPKDDFAGCPADPTQGPPWVKIQSSSPDGHGNHVAGIIAAATNNALGVAGVAFGAEVLPIRVLAECAGFDSDVADAIVWASGDTVDEILNPDPAEVINLSLGRPGECGDVFQDAIDIAVGNGSTVVVAAGNSNYDVANHAPANCTGVIAVASTTDAGAESSYSNHGSQVDIAAPGTDIMSTYLPGSNAYLELSGTSMAAPHVSGVVALVQSVATTPRTPAQMEMLLKATARAFPVTPAQSLGAGIVDAAAAVEAVLLPVCDPDGKFSDFSCDGMADVLWRNDDGDIEAWYGANAGNNGPLQSMSTSWELVGIGDFDGNLRSDILWRRDTGSNRIWLDGDGAQPLNLLSLADSNWKVVGVGDFNEDGRADILWRNVATGANRIWLEPVPLQAHQYVTLPNVPTEWEVVGLGHFDSDDIPDIIWRNNSTTQVLKWNDGDPTSTKSLSTNWALAWKVAGIGDFNGDGKSDILWRRTDTGANLIWSKGLSVYSTTLPSVGSAWSVEAVADYDGDGEDDILWRKGSTDLVVWPSADPTASWWQAPNGNNWDVVP